MFNFEVVEDGKVYMFEGDVGKSGMSVDGLIKMVDDCILDYLENEVDMNYDGLDKLDEVDNFKIVFLGIK